MIPTEEIEMEIIMEEEEEDNEFSTDEELDEPLAEPTAVTTSPPAVPQPASSVEAQPKPSGPLGFTNELSSLLATKMGSLKGNSAETAPKTGDVHEADTQNYTLAENKGVVSSKPVVANKPTIANKPAVAKKPKEAAETGMVKGSQRRRPPPPPVAKVWYTNFVKIITVIFLHSLLLISLQLMHRKIWQKRLLPMLL